MEIIIILFVAWLAYLAYTNFKKNSPQARLERDSALMEHYFKLVMKDVAEDLNYWVEKLKKCKAGEFTIHTEPEVQEQIDTYDQEEKDLKVLYRSIKVRL